MITSRQHPLIKRLIKLEESTHYRKETNLTLLDGLHLIQTYRAAWGFPEQVIASESYLRHCDNSKSLHELLGVALPKIVVVSDALMRIVSPVKAPTGILAIIAKPVVEKVDNNVVEDFSLLLENIQDPGNLGSILRSAASANANNAYLSNNCSDAWSPKTLRAGMGGQFFLDIYENSNLVKIAQGFPGQVVATSLTATKDLFDISLRGPVAFVFGNEGSGISSELMQQADEVIRIPMPGKTESLNVAAAAAICMFEKVRQDNIAADNRIDAK
ncbi:RNA methyltransferase, TrmH family [Nitrosomonas sp. PY1]|uniref:TrmH family RNA methyltransferase n=1 Tax=Nitrosomonas sp. PY1 TaxID=1803906 RepID=UPI001FC888A5|nr:RNA methyltransferase [Nitrosomonas sp. PY1]GKS69312.1 RNA methyltransferase, TrmH family [Nitrosomonas sp. PY1]